MLRMVVLIRLVVQAVRVLLARLVLLVVQRDRRLVLLVLAALVDLVDPVDQQHLLYHLVRVNQALQGVLVDRLLDRLHQEVLPGQVNQQFPGVLEFLVVLVGPVVRVHQQNHHHQAVQVYLEFLVLLLIPFRPVVLARLP